MNNRHLTVIMYHYVRDLKNSRYPNIKGLDVNLFKEQIKFLKKNYNVIRMEDVISASKGVGALPPHAALLTFDDGYIDHFTNVFPILKNNNLQGSFFAPVKAITEHKVLDVNKIHFILASTPKNKIYLLLNEIRNQLIEFQEEFNLNTFDYYFDKLAQTGRFDPAEIIFIKRLLQVELPVDLRLKITNNLFEKIVGVEEGAFSKELYMSIDQIKCMVNAGMHIGTHGYDHFWLGSLSKQKQEFEIERSIDFIKEVGGNVNEWTICYPYGSYNNDTIEIIKDKGCKLGLTTEVAIATIYSQMGDNVFKIPRLDTNDLPKEEVSIPNKWYN
ncbi:MAG: polysaccharide deacetylase family protein [Tissierellia bacterium]|nr:polysaccharide deacetylase family protein [Tissierellia bacterium]MDD4781031.1 polysaccharide deacetylase family protein [Tissierellia bacterium]